MRSPVNQVATIGADLDGKPVFPGRAHLGPPRPAGLEQQAGGVARRRLVDLELMPGAFMGQQGGRCRDAQPVDRISGGAKPDVIGQGARIGLPETALPDHLLPSSSTQVRQPVFGVMVIQPLPS